MPFVTSYDADDALEDVLEIVLFAVLVLSIIVIIWLGLYLSRLLSRQIIEPLAELRKAAAEIQQGNFEYPLVVPAQDELGQSAAILTTCARNCGRCGRNGRSTSRTARN